MFGCKQGEFWMPKQGTDISDQEGIEGLYGMIIDCNEFFLFEPDLGFFFLSFILDIFFSLKY